MRCSSPTARAYPPVCTAWLQRVLSALLLLELALLVPLSFLDLKPFVVESLQELLLLDVSGRRTKQLTRKTRSTALETWHTYPSLVYCVSSSSMPSCSLNLSQSNDVFSIVDTFLGASKDASTLSSPVPLAELATFLETLNEG